LSGIDLTDVNKLAFIYYEPEYLIKLYDKASSFNKGYAKLDAEQRKEI